MYKLILSILIISFLLFYGCNKNTQTAQNNIVPTEKPLASITEIPHLQEPTEIKAVTKVPQRQEPTAVKYIMGEDDKKLVNSNLDFAFKLFGEVNKDDFKKNICISPLSIAIALEMQYNGANGETKEAMTKTLSLIGLKLDKVNDSSYKIVSSLKSSREDLELSIANSIWIKSGYEFNPEFEKICRKYYDSEVKKGITADAVNSWCNEKTKGKIPAILDNLRPLDIAILLANAVYFKGIWEYKFDKGKTKNENFTLLNGNKKKVSMMDNLGDFYYYNNKTFESIRLPYKGKKLSMYIFLPNKNSSLEAFQKNLNMENWKKWMNGFHKLPVQIILPKFTMNYEKNLNGNLKSLGMEIAFSGNADFKKMILSNKGLFISEVLHKTFIEVNEEGTEAAAVTAISNMFSGGLDPVHPISMIVNRPFFFAIRDNDTGTILFMGSIVDPEI